MQPNAPTTRVEKCFLRLSRIEKQLIQREVLRRSARKSLSFRDRAAKAPRQFDLVSDVQDLCRDVDRQSRAHHAAGGN